MANTENFSKYFEITDYEQLYHQIDKEQKERHELSKQYQNNLLEADAILNTSKKYFWNSVSYNKLDPNLKQKIKDIRTGNEKLFDDCLNKGFLPDGKEFFDEAIKFKVLD